MEAYDITAFPPSHPDDSDVLSAYCGQEGSSFMEIFEGKYGTSEIDVLENGPIRMGDMGGR